MPVPRRFSIPSPIGAFLLTPHELLDTVRIGNVTALRSVVWVGDAQREPTMSVNREKMRKAGYRLSYEHVGDKWISKSERKFGIASEQAAGPMVMVDPVTHGMVDINGRAHVNLCGPSGMLDELPRKAPPWLQREGRDGRTS